MPLPKDGLLIDESSEWYDASIKEQFAKKSSIDKQDYDPIGSIFKDKLNLFKYGIASYNEEMPPDQIDIPVEDSIFFHNSANRYVEQTQSEDITWMRNSNQIQENRVDRESLMSKSAKRKVDISKDHDFKAIIDKTFNVEPPQVHPKSKKKLKKSIPLHPYFQCMGPDYAQLIFPDGLDVDENEEEQHLDTIVVKPYKNHLEMYKCSPEHSDMIIQCRQENSELNNEVVYTQIRNYMLEQSDNLDDKFLNIIIDNDNAYYIPNANRYILKKLRVFVIHLEVQI